MLTFESKSQLNEKDTTEVIVVFNGSKILI